MKGIITQMKFAVGSLDLPTKLQKFFGIIRGLKDKQNFFLVLQPGEIMLLAAEPGEKIPQIEDPQGLQLDLLQKESFPEQTNTVGHFNVISHSQVSDLRHNTIEITYCSQGDQPLNEDQLIGLIEHAWNWAEQNSRLLRFFVVFSRDGYSQPSSAYALVVLPDKQFIIPAAQQFPHIPENLQLRLKAKK